MTKTVFQNDYCSVSIDTSKTFVGDCSYILVGKHNDTETINGIADNVETLFCKAICDVSHDVYFGFGLKTPIREFTIRPVQKVSVPTSSNMVISTPFTEIFHEQNFSVFMKQNNDKHPADVYVMSCNHGDVKMVNNGESHRKYLVADMDFYSILAGAAWEIGVGKAENEVDDLLDCELSDIPSEIPSESHITYIIEAEQMS